MALDMLFPDIMKFITPLLIFALCYMQNASANSIIYKSVDKSGNTVIGNKKTTGSTILNLPPLNVYATPMSKSDLHAKGLTPKRSSLKHATLHTVTHSSTNKYNNNKRRQILQEELNQEQHALLDSQAMLKDAKQIKYPSAVNNQKSYDARINLLQHSVKVHKQNIKLLTKELH